MVFWFRGFNFIPCSLISLTCESDEPFSALYADASSVSVDSSSTTSLTISWTLAEGLTATDYTISYSNTDTECFNISYDDITTSQTMSTLTGLEEGTEYSITMRVTATLSGGETGEYSADTTATTMTTG